MKPVNIRNHVDNFGDPYRDDSNDSVRTCMHCGMVYWGHRWYTPDQAKKAGIKVDNKMKSGAICTACRKTLDKAPGGVLTITGEFAQNHCDEIMNLIQNENDRAIETNPMERIINIERSDGRLEITTTNEKLAQRIGRALFKAYDGEVTYRWSEDTKLARVFWHR